MITDALLNFVALIITAITAVLPAVSLPASLSSSAITVFGEIGKLNWLFPITDFFIVAGLIMAFEIALIGIRLPLWIIHLIRGN